MNGNLAMDLAIEANSQDELDDLMAAIRAAVKPIKGVSSVDYMEADLDFEPEEE